MSWIDWQLAATNRGQLRFFRKLIALRKRHPIFRRDDFFQYTDSTYGAEISWQGVEPGDQDWSASNRALGFLLNGAALQEGSDDDFFVMLNGSRETAALFTVPVPSRQRLWRKIIDTSLKPPADIVDPDQADQVECKSKLTVAPMGCLVLQSVPAR